MIAEWDEYGNFAQPVQERYYQELRAVNVTGRAIEKQLMEDK